MGPLIYTVTGGGGQYPRFRFFHGFGSRGVSREGRNGQLPWFRV